MKLCCRGGDIIGKDFDDFLQKQAARYTFLPEEVLVRYARAYGTRMEGFLHGVNKVADLGQHFGDHMYEAEVLYLLKYEFAHTVEDILWRRSKMGLHVSQATAQKIEIALPQMLKVIAGQTDRYENAAG